MDRSQILSGIGHTVVILWVVLGDWLFAPRELPPPESVQVSMISEADLQALQDAAPKARTPAETPAVKPVKKPEVKAPKPVEADLPPAEPLPEPALPATQPAPSEPLPDTLPVSPDPQLVEAPEPVAPIAAEEQPILVPDAAATPKPRPAKRITEVPVEDSNDTPEVADQATPEVSDQPSDLPPVAEEQPTASPEDSAAMIAPDAEETDAPELAPTRSRRPQTRPETPVEQPEEPPVDPAPPQNDSTADAEADAIAAALAAAEADAPVEDIVEDIVGDIASADTASDGSPADVPEGPPMTAGEKEGVRVSINSCWNIGSLSTAAQRVILVLRVEMGEDGKPISDSISMTSYEGGDDAAAQQAFEAARRAVVRGVKGCGGKPGYDLDPAKYSEWNVMNLTFDASGMRLR